METQPEFVPYTDRTFKRSGDGSLVLREADRIRNLAEALEAIALDAKIRHLGMSYVVIKY